MDAKVAPAVMQPKPAVLRVAAVSYLNAKPLVWGLEKARNIDLMLDVPSRLADGLRDGRWDVALLPVIDYQRIPGLRLLTAGGIGCDGPTLTVRIFSNRPIEKITRLACDPDSHTSVALARVILAECFNLHPQFVEVTGKSWPDCDAKLLIGDKVVCEEPAGLDHQLDLGAAWKKLTGLPFVFAIWTARGGIDLLDLPQRLEQARREGLEQVEKIISKYATPRGWPAGVALQYLTMYLRYEIGPEHLEAIRLFHELAAKHGQITTPLMPLRVYGRDEG